MSLLPYSALFTENQLRACWGIMFGDTPRYDPSRGATLAYNSLNLPRRVGLGATTLDYTYDTGGTKRSLSQNGSVTSYEGAFEYDGAGLPTRISTQEGQMVKNGSGVWQWQYYLRDHLGNVRVVLAEGGAVVQS